ncbi:hypothetical protein CKO25_09295 [Thiocapsa imhoffii]|uniref:CN hydrolase domain-containing protein n=2 Tax=Thiocapsa imhoffii TaxID=382777 RepID=A0A9X1B8F3_9GAMM|nr:hypothetical protein [Thiocapsa imhoffii]
MTIALGQLNLVWGDPAANLAQVRSWTAEAAEQGADLIVFPELWSTGYDLARAEDHATAIDAGIFKATASLARAHGIAILGSCLARLEPGRIANTAVYVDATGQTRAAYSKTHLFGLMQEDRYLTAGERLELVDTGWGLFGLAICYDLRFPELFRSYALAGACAVVIPAEWPEPRCAHWRTLLQARAIENQMFVIACNRAGSDANNRFCGQSCIIDPMGDMLVEADDQPQLLIAELDLSLIAQTRARIPVFDDRRPELYSGSNSGS